MALEFTDANFQQVVIESDKLSVIDFWVWTSRRSQLSVRDYQFIDDVITFCAIDFIIAIAAIKRITIRFADYQIVAVANGTAQMGHDAAYYHTGKTEGAVTAGLVQGAPCRAVPREALGPLVDVAVARDIDVVQTITIWRDDALMSKRLTRANRRVDAMQDGKLLATALVSYLSGGHGLEHNFEMPVVPEPQLGACRQNLAISLARWSGVAGL